MLRPSRCSDKPAVGGEVKAALEKKVTKEPNAIRMNERFIK
jgi:hypothetical protein